MKVIIALLMTSQPSFLMPKLKTVLLRGTQEEEDEEAAAVRGVFFLHRESYRFSSPSASQLKVASLVK